jgi:ABC-type phosphate transport system permease subunit
MSSTNLFGLFCLFMVGVFFMLLFHEKSRAAITSRSTWVADHPRGYVFATAIFVVTVLTVAYIIAIGNVQ